MKLFACEGARTGRLWEKLLFGIPGSAAIQQLLIVRNQFFTSQRSLEIFSVAQACLCSTGTSRPRVHTTLLHLFKKLVTSQLICPAALFNHPLYLQVFPVNTCEGCFGIFDFKANFLPQLMYHSEIDPPARESVKRINPDLWTLGSKMMCVKAPVQDISQPNACCSWEDGGCKFYLLPRDETVLVNSDEGDPAIDRMHECGTGGSVWRIGNEAICKVKSWREDRQVEADTIAFVRANFPQIPLPEVLYSWIDKAINRAYLILRRVHSRTLNSAWPELSVGQRLNIASEVAQYCSVLGQKTSLKYETISGHGVLEHSLMGKLPASHPSWLPPLVGPFSGSEMKAYMARISSAPIPEFVESFLFYHPDLGPTNILISDDGEKVAAIIDWEAAAYFPSFWVATRPATNWAFQLSEPNSEDEKNQWSNLFVKAIEEKGFKCLQAAYTTWKSAVNGPA